MATRGNMTLPITRSDRACTDATSRVSLTSGAFNTLLAQPTNHCHVIPIQLPQNSKPSATNLFQTSPHRLRLRGLPYRPLKYGQLYLKTLDSSQKWNLNNSPPKISLLSWELGGATVNRSYSRAYHKASRGQEGLGHSYIDSTWPGWSSQVLLMGLSTEFIRRRRVAQSSGAHVPTLPDWLPRVRYNVMRLKRLKR